MGIESRVARRLHYQVPSFTRVKRVLMFLVFLRRNSLYQAVKAEMDKNEKKCINGNYNVMVLVCST